MRGCSRARNQVGGSEVQEVEEGSPKEATGVGNPRKNVGSRGGEGGRDAPGEWRGAVV